MAEMRTTTTPDGRLLEYVVSGPPDGAMLLLHLGTPVAATEIRAFSEPAAKLGLMTVSYSRPGYGESTPQADRTVADTVGDAVLVLDELGATTFYTMGWSGGGPHALACAALLPDRCLATSLLAGVAPYPSAGLDFLAGMDESNVTELGAAIAGRDPLIEVLTEMATELEAITADGVVESMHGLLSDVDRACMTGDFAADLADGLRRSVASGIDGWLDDDLAFVQPWGFDLDGIEVPVAIWQGAQDRMVPFAHGRWLAEHVPGSRAQLFQDEGHVSLVRQADRILADLLAAAD
jgi:pimeloyl-ACP methyl ester carboxylesterase